MTENTKDINTKHTSTIETISKEQAHFKSKIVKLNALTSVFNEEGSDILNAEHESKNGLKALDTKGGLQEMLAAQMLSVHQLQQISIAMANKTIHRESSRQYFVNAAIKLANTFVQQANILSRLQGNGGQKITIERVDVHHGGQAVVGNINEGAPHHKVKK